MRANQPWAALRRRGARGCRIGFPEMYTSPVDRADSAARDVRLAESPILLVGAPRSGTTLVQRLLLADPRCCGSQES
ncbi:MAG: sulfotransferase, partial [Phycisphaerales bacterium]